MSSPDRSSRGRKDPREGIGRWGRPSRHRPPGHTATAEAAQGERSRSNAPGPPGDLHTARIATDTWPGTAPNEPRTAVPAGPGAPGERQAPAGGSDSSG
jgi:hypothetical protein